MAEEIEDLNKKNRLKIKEKKLKGKKLQRRKKRKRSDTRANLKIMKIFY